MLASTQPSPSNRPPIVRQRHPSSNPTWQLQPLPHIVTETVYAILWHVSGAFTPSLHDIDLAKFHVLYSILLSNSSFHNYVEIPASLSISSLLGHHLSCSALSVDFSIMAFSHHSPQLVKKMRSRSSGKSLRVRAASTLEAPVSLWAKQPQIGARNTATHLQG